MLLTRIRLAGDSRGSIVAIVAVTMPVALLFAALVIDIGNWFGHKRNLQNQVDAGVLAAGSLFSGCFGQNPDTNPAGWNAANAAIRAQAMQYAGDPTVAGSYNRQFGDPDSSVALAPSVERRVHVLANSPAYYGDPGAQDGVLTDGTGVSVPCSTKSLQLRATDKDEPAIFGIVPSGVNPLDIKAKAKVEIRKLQSFSGMLPWAVPDVIPAAVVALFVDESSGNVYRNVSLFRDNDPATGQPRLTTLGGSGAQVNLWTTGGSSATVDIPGSDNGVVILVSSNPSPSLTANDLPTLCGQRDTKCLSGTSDASGLSFIHGYAATGGGSPTAPVARDVQLTFGACTGNDNPYFQFEGGCTYTVTADVDFQSPPTPIDAKVWVDAPGCPTGGANNGCPMTYDSGLWSASVPGLPADSGRTTIDLVWETCTLVGGCKTNETTQGRLSNVAHPYVSDEKSDPVKFVQISEGATINANSVTRSSHSFAIAVGLQPSLTVAQTGNEVPILLRAAKGSGSNNQALDCDRGQNPAPYNFNPAPTFKEEIIDGCKTQYTVNVGTQACPIGQDPGPLPLYCILNETGDKVGPIRQAMAARFESPCTTNNWPYDPARTSIPVISPDDPRLVTLIITDFTAFKKQGQGYVPVRHFAGFYVTGWDSTTSLAGDREGCLDNDLHPLGSKKQKTGDVWGHFVVFVVPSGQGTEDPDALCAFDSLGNCVAVLTE